jgi:DNA-binding FrmR family transcriptional regulator
MTRLPHETEKEAIMARKVSPKGRRSADRARKSHHPERLKAALISRLNRTEGQIRGVRRMVEDDTYCDDVLNQISSIQSALAGLSRLLLEHHIKSCVVDQIRAGEVTVIDELMITIGRLTKATKKGVSS